MSLPDELAKLAQLRAEGRLTDQEFADVKKRALAESQPAWPSPGNANRTFREAVATISEKTYKSSRWSSGNMFFPDRLTLANDGILFRKGAMFGSTEEHISYQAVASFRTKNGLLLSTLFIETSGGSQPIVINGLWKSDAKKIQDTLRSAQGGG